MSDQTNTDTALGRFSDALADVITEACAQWQHEEPDDYAESLGKIGRGELRFVVTAMVAPNAVPEFVFGVIDGEGNLRKVSHMVVPPTN